MPHVSIKMYPGRSEEKKKEMASRITADIVAVAGCSADYVTVAIEEIDQDKWPEEVYRPEIMEKSGRLYKKPGYNPFKD
ncbi:MAG: 4-oxalocrotonate tautomerase [Deltaproteobacteria bacterium]|nr:4-oxalocrotonate tautomerase [Deltaproteobacteria bacterium]